MKFVDVPPIWLLAFLILTWFVPLSLPWGGAFWPGVVLLVIAALLTVGALLEFARARTTVVPHQAPSALITGGIFRWTRNPIYLADILILAGFTLIWGRALGVALIPLLVFILDRRFIRPEEARLNAAFGEEFAKYMTVTRRWV